MLKSNRVTNCISSATTSLICCFLVYIQIYNTYEYIDESYTHTETTKKIYTSTSMWKDNFRVAFVFYFPKFPTQCRKFRKGKRGLYLGTPKVHYPLQKCPRSEPDYYVIFLWRPFWYYSLQSFHLPWRSYLHLPYIPWKSFSSIKTPEQYYMNSTKYEACYCIFYGV